MRDLAVDEAHSRFAFAFLHSSHSCTRGWVEERKGVCLCGWVGREKDISELDSHCGVCSVIRVTTIYGEAFSCVCVLAQLVLQDRFKSTYEHTSSSIRNLTRYTKH